MENDGEKKKPDRANVNRQRKSLQYNLDSGKKRKGVVEESGKRQSPYWVYTKQVKSDVLRSKGLRTMPGVGTTLIHSTKENLLQKKVKWKVKVI